MCCIIPIVLCVKVNAQCDKMMTVVGQTKLTTLVMVDVQWRNFSKSRVGTKFQREVHLFL